MRLSWRGARRGGEGKMGSRDGWKDRDGLVG
jgi:hypothetical protein